MASTKPGHDVREQVLKTAEILFSRKGIEQTSLLDISQKAKISRGTISYYFPTKQEILLAVTDRHMDAVTSEFAKIIKEKSLTTPEEILTVLFDLVLSDRFRGGIHAHLLQEATRGNRAVRKRIAARYKVWNALIVKEFNRLGVRGKKKEKAAFILSVIDGLVVRQILFGSQARKGPFPDLIATALRMK